MAWPSFVNIEQHCIDTEKELYLGVYYSFHFVLHTCITHNSKAYLKGTVGWEILAENFFRDRLQWWKLKSEIFFRRIIRVRVSWVLIMDYGTVCKISIYSILCQMVRVMKIKRDENLIGRNFYQRKFLDLGYKNC